MPNATKPTKPTATKPAAQQNGKTAPAVAPATPAPATPETAPAVVLSVVLSGDAWVAAFVAATRTGATITDETRVQLRDGYRAMSHTDAVATRALAMSGAFTTPDPDTAAIIGLSDHVAAPDPATARTRKTAVERDPNVTAAMRICAAWVAFVSVVNAAPDAAVVLSAYAHDHGPGSDTDRDAIISHAARIVATITRNGTGNLSGPKQRLRVAGTARGAGRRHVAHVAGLFPVGTVLTAAELATVASPDYPAADPALSHNVAGQLVPAPATGPKSSALSDVIRKLVKNGPAVIQNGPNWDGSQDGTSYRITVRKPRNP